MSINVYKTSSYTAPESNKVTILNIGGGGDSVDTTRFLQKNNSGTIYNLDLPFGLNDGSIFQWVPNSSTLYVKGNIVATGGIQARSIDDTISIPSYWQALRFIREASIGNTLYWNNGRLEASGTGGGTWGSITGTLSNQTDLANALGGKIDNSNALQYNVWFNLDDPLTSGNIRNYFGWTNTNVPNSGFGTYLSWGAQNDDYGAQIAIPYDRDEFHYRRFVNGATGGWKKLAHADTPEFTGQLSLGGYSDNYMRMHTPSGIRIASTSSTGGGWARAYGFCQHSSGVDFGGFGAMGGADSLSYYFVGRAYNDHNIYVEPDGKVELKYDGSKKLETNAYGVSVSGTVYADNVIIN